MSLALSAFQQRIYDKASTGVAYTWTQIVALAKEFAADTTIGTPGSQIFPNEIINGELRGLCKCNYFDPAIRIGGSQLVLADWRFWKVASPVVPTPPITVSYEIPLEVQGETLTGVAPSGY